MQRETPVAPTDGRRTDSNRCTPFVSINLVAICESRKQQLKANFFTAKTREDNGFCSSLAKHSRT